MLTFNVYISLFRTHQVDDNDDDEKKIKKRDVGIIKFSIST